MKKLFLTLILLFTTSCASLDWFVGVDENGQDKEGPAPSDYLAKALEALGPLGGIAGTLIVGGGAAYVGNKKSKDPLKAVITAVDKVKEGLSAEEKQILVTTLKQNIPDKYHKVIDGIRGKI